MTFGIKDMIARCIERMRGGACATCDNRAFWCPAGRWQEAFGTERDEPRDGGFFSLLAGLLQSLAQPESKPRCFRKEVEDSIEPLLGSGEVSIDRVARELAISRQTLYRRLKSEGVTFEEILEAKRRSLAIRLLGIQRLSVKSAAYQLGFSDPAAFSRAFKRWTGTSPSRFRTA